MSLYKGSLLGPLLFLCFSADLKNLVNPNTVSMYADDTKLFRMVDSVSDCLELELDIKSLSGRISGNLN